MAPGEVRLRCALPMTRTLPLRSALVVLLGSPSSHQRLRHAGQRRASPDDVARQRSRPASARAVATARAGIDIGMLRYAAPARRCRRDVERTGYVPGYDGYGKVVVLDLDGPYTALYAHLSADPGPAGPALRKGQRLGLAGCSGSCSGTHLHFEVKRRGVPVDPLRFLG